MRAARVASEEQLRLIMECRSSGLTDYEWCLQNDIKPGTFYNWVKRLRQKGYTEIPDALHGHIRQKQEIVKIELPNSIPNESAVFCADEYCGQSYKDMMKLSIAGTVLEIPNGTDPVLLREMLHILKELSC